MYTALRSRFVKYKTCDDNKLLKRNGIRRIMTRTWRREFM